MAIHFYLFFFLRQLQEKLVSKGTLDLPKFDSAVGDTIYEYVVNEQGQWEHWDERVPQYIYPSDSTPEYNSILVPNTDNVRTDFLISTIAKQEKAILLIGRLVCYTGPTLHNIREYTAFLIIIMHDLQALCET